MKRLITILVLLAAILGFGSYSSFSIGRQNDDLQKMIADALDVESPSPAQISEIAARCHALTDGLGMVLNDDKVSTVSYQAYLTEFAAEQQDDAQMREALFLLSRALADLAESEQITIQSLL